MAAIELTNDPRGSLSVAHTGSGFLLEATFSDGTRLSGNLTVPQLRLLLGETGYVRTRELSAARHVGNGRGDKVQIYFNPTACMAVVHTAELATATGVVL